MLLVLGSASGVPHLPSPDVLRTIASALAETIPELAAQRMASITTS